MAKELSERAKRFRSGLYRHYKNQNYFAFRVVRHTETEEEMVWYQPLYGGYGWRLRPLTSATPAEGGFLDFTESGVPRFIFLGPDISPLTEITADKPSLLATAVTPGRWRHYKGGLMRVVGVAQHSEIPESKGNEFVIYHHDGPDSDQTWWARPIQSFFEMVDVGGKHLKRFDLVDRDE